MGEATAKGRRTDRSVNDLPVIPDCGSSDIEYIREPELARGAVVALTGDSGSGKSTLATAWARDAWRSKGIPALFLDRENPISVIADRLARLGDEDGPGMRFWGGWLPEEAPQPGRADCADLGEREPRAYRRRLFSAFLEGDQNDAAIVRAFLHRCRGGPGRYGGSNPSRWQGRNGQGLPRLQRFQGSD